MQVMLRKRGHGQPRRVLLATSQGWACDGVCPFSPQSRNNDGNLHSQLLPPTALLIFYRAVSMLQTSKYLPPSQAGKPRLYMPNQKPPVNETPPGAPPLPWRPLGPASASWPSLKSTYFQPLWPGGGEPQGPHGASPGKGWHGGDQPPGPG